MCQNCIRKQSLLVLSRYRKKLLENALLGEKSFHIPIWLAQRCNQFLIKTSSCQPRRVCFLAKTKSKKFQAKRSYFADKHKRRKRLWTKMAQPKQNSNPANRMDKQAAVISTVAPGAKKDCQSQWLTHNPARRCLALPPLNTDAHTQHLTARAAFLQNHPPQREATPASERSLKRGRENAKEGRKQGAVPAVLYRRL